nr:hypothetical protein GACBDANE_00021 [Spodoptera litura nucleopolyhedrovirus]
MAIVSGDMSTFFNYDEHEPIEVFVIENNLGGGAGVDTDSFVEIKSLCKLIAPLVNIRHFNPAMLWSTTQTSHRLIKNGKNYVHMFTICKYLSSYNLSNRAHPHEYYALKQLLRDMFIGRQVERSNEEIATSENFKDIKNKLCSLQECLTVGGVAAVVASDDPTISTLNDCLKNLTDLVYTVRSDTAVMYADLNSAIENLKTQTQLDVMNKIAFGNDTLLDGIKSIKDILLSRNSKKQHQQQTVS